MKANKKLLSFILSGIMTVTTCSAFSAYAVPDPDGDGKIGINDAVLIMQYLAGRFEPTDLSRLDINENGVVSAMDAYYAQLYEAGTLH